MLNCSILLCRGVFEVGLPVRAVRLFWDWRMARILDDEGQCVDEAVWSKNRSISTLAKRLQMQIDGRMTNEARHLHERFPEAVVSYITEVDVDWPAMEGDERELLQGATLMMAESGVSSAASEPDRRLEHLVRATDELRSSHNTLESRIIEWAGMFLPTLDLDARRAEIAPAVADSDDLAGLAAALGVEAADTELSKAEWKALKGWANTTVESAAHLIHLEDAVRHLSESHLPSLSLLLGPLLASRLCVTARGRARLARLPSGTVQILGAEKAFFVHLKQGTDPPKHGHLFQHPWVCRSPRWVRGKIARMVAGKASIAARVDHFGGEIWGEAEVAKVENAVAEIRARHLQPRGR